MNKLFINRTRIEIRRDKDDEPTELLLSMIPTMHRNRSDTIWVTSISNIKVVLEVLRGVTPDNIEQLPNDIKLYYYYITKRDEHAKELLKNGPKGDHPFLMSHQLLGVELARVYNKYGFFYDTRTGKTLMSLEIIKEDLEKNPDNQWLILAPQILIEEAWFDDIRKFYKHFDARSLHCSKVYRQKRLDEYHSIYISSSNNLSNTVDDFIDYGFAGVILDESSCLRSHSTLTSKAAVRLSESVPRWYILSGTPAPNGEYEYYTQLRTIDKYAVQPNYTQFTKRYFDDISRNPTYTKLVAKSETKGELTSLISTMAVYLDKEDAIKMKGNEHLSLAGQEDIFYEFDVPSELFVEYERMRRDMYIEVGDEVITADMAGAKINKLNQLASGFIYDTETEETHTLSLYKFIELMKILKQHPGKQIVIWAYYRHEFEIIKKFLGDTCGIVNGTVTLTEKQAAIRNFKQGNLQYLVANPASADKGLTLTNAHIAIYFTLSHSYELFKQSRERIYGFTSIQSRKCLYIHMFPRKTITKSTYDVLTGKRELCEAVYAHLRVGAE